MIMFTFHLPMNIRSSRRALDAAASAWKCDPQCVKLPRPAAGGAAGAGVQTERRQATVEQVWWGPTVR